MRGFIVQRHSDDAFLLRLALQDGKEALCETKIVRAWRAAVREEGVCGGEGGEGGVCEVEVVEGEGEHAEVVRGGGERRMEGACERGFAGALDASEAEEEGGPGGGGGGARGGWWAGVVGLEEGEEEGDDCGGFGCRRLHCCYCRVVVVWMKKGARGAFLHYIAIPEILSESETGAPRHRNAHAGVGK